MYKEDLYARYLLVLMQSFEIRMQCVISSSFFLFFKWIGYPGFAVRAVQ